MEIDFDFVCFVIELNTLCRLDAEKLINIPSWLNCSASDLQIELNSATKLFKEEAILKLIRVKLQVRLS